MMVFKILTVFKIFNVTSYRAGEYSTYSTWTFWDSFLLTSALSGYLECLLNIHERSVFALGRFLWKQVLACRDVLC
jgi:hypothetical protein